MPIIFSGTITFLKKWNTIENKQEFITNVKNICNYFRENYKKFIIPLSTKNAKDPDNLNTYKFIMNLEFGKKNGFAHIHYIIAFETDSIMIDYKKINYLFEQGTGINVNARYRKFNDAVKLAEQYTEKDKISLLE